MRRNPRRTILLLVLVASGLYWVQQTAANKPTYQFSGTLEATNIYLASQLGGQVKNVNSSVGEQVHVGQSLIDIYSPINGVNERITSPIDGVLLERLVEPG